jgi:uncharacterized phage-associated protein
MVVAKYILHLIGFIKPLRLQRLCYYCQAWYLAYDRAPLFPEDFKAWAGGPVCDELYQFHKGHLQNGLYFLYDGDLGEYDDSALTNHQKEHIDKVLKEYGDCKAFKLSMNIHDELPWVEARSGLLLGDRCESIISKETMAIYYAKQDEIGIAENSLDKDSTDFHLVTALDVAKYILHKVGPLVYMKLQMLCYYSQAWTLVWDEIPLFSEEFLAYSCGPICKEIFEPDGHPEFYYLNDGDYGEYDDSILSVDQQGNIDFTLNDYSKHHARELIDFACSELPWLAARDGLPKGMDSDNVVSKDDMEEYYAGQLLSDD